MIFRATRFRRGGLFLLVTVLGCTNANVALNPGTVPLESRRCNRTRAALFTDVRPTDDAPASPTQTERAVVPTNASACRSPLPADRDGYFVGLCLSGGGSRSANFSAACMFQLERIGLLDKVDYISSVSGGSLTAAYYCLNGPDWNPQTVQKKLTHSFATDLYVQTLMPWNLAALTFTDLDRSDLLANSFRANLFSRDGKTLTYQDLRPDRPRLLINATDLQSGRRFVFGNESFDQLNSDLSKYPVAYAVAASSAVPILLHQVTLRDFSTGFATYRHLIDGGVADNLGLQTLVETYSAQVNNAHVAKAADPYPNGAVFIVIDAHTRFNADLSDKGDVGLIQSLRTAAGLTSTALLNRASSATLADIIVRNAADDATAAELRRQIRQLTETGLLELRDRTGHTVRVVYLSLSEVDSLHDLPFEGFRESINSISTYFNISDLETYHLYQAADLLVRERFEAPLRKITRALEEGARTRANPS